jgi:iron complex transport system substrate-binding protein
VSRRFNYLRLLHLPLGLLINFGVATFKEGVKRIANHHRDFAPRAFASTRREK